MSFCIRYFVKIKDNIRIKTLGQADSTASTSIKSNDNFKVLSTGLIALLDFLTFNDTESEPSITIPNGKVIGNLAIGSINAEGDLFSVETSGRIRSKSFNTDYTFTGRLVVKPVIGTIAPIDAGEIRFDGTSFLGYNGSDWIDFGGGSAFAFGFPNIVPLGATVTVGLNRQIFVYGNLIVRGTLINNGEIVCANGDVTIDSGTFIQNGVTKLVTFTVV